MLAELIARILESISDMVPGDVVTQVIELITAALG